jgi:hypothetical protein
MLYFLGTVWAWSGLRSLLKREPFAESIAQAKRDSTWLDSSN